MWYIFFEIPSGLILFVIVLIMALSDSAGKWVIENMMLITCLVYIAEIVMGSVRCYRYKKNHISLFVSVPFTLMSMLPSTQYLMRILSDIAEMASGGILGFLGLLISAPLAILSCVIVKGPSMLVNILAKDNEADTALVIGDGIITVLLCLVCSWFFGYI